MRHALVLVLCSLGVVAVGVFVLLAPADASGKDCGGTPLTVLTRGAGGEAARAGVASDCEQTAWESTALGFSVAGIGAVMAVATVALRERTG
jgi:hypothetical protein